jgi:uncharacterized protein (TIGR04255 family)
MRLQNDWPKRYHRDPIAEVIIGVRFDGAKTAEQQLRSIQEELERDLGGPGQDEWWVEVSAILENQALAAKAIPRFGQRVFSSADGQWRLTVADGLAALHVMRPYPGWVEKVRDQALKMIQVCTSQLGAYRLREVSVRYVDDIGLPQDRPLDRYFRLGHVWPEAEDEQDTGFDLLVRRRFPSQRARGQVRFFSVPPQHQGLPHFILDVAAIYQAQDLPLQLTELDAYLNALHGLQRQMFESVITDELRELLGAER